MDTPKITTNLDNFYLDILGQQPKINRLYTQIVFCFPALKDSFPPTEVIIDILTEGLERLSVDFPWVTGKVVQDEDDTFKIKPFEKIPRFIVKDYMFGEDDDNHHGRNVPDWTTLQRAKFPFSMLDESDIAAQNTLAVLHGGQSVLEEAIPVFLVQANFITGGLLLTFSAQHGSMDMAGQVQVIHLLAKACRNEPFTISELSIGNMDRKNIIPLFDDYTQDPGVNHPLTRKNTVDEGRQRSKKSPSQSHQQLSNNCTWAYFLFSAASLATLKSLALTTTPLNGFVSTDDTLSAFIWKSVTNARLPRIINTTFKQNSTLSRNVDVRRHFSIPVSYPGLVTSTTIHTAAIDVLVEESLGTLATDLRLALNPTSLKHKTRNLATIISKDRNSENATFVPTSVPELDVRISSWAKENCAKLDFGFGRPVAVRRPRFTEGTREGLVYFLPKTLEGEIAVAVCLRHEDMERLKMSEEFTKFGTYIG